MRANFYKGKFIVFEGLDGSGQTTQSRLLADFLIRKGKEVFLTKEPTANSSFAQKIRQALFKEIECSPEQLQIWFAKDRKEHLENEILPALEVGKIVISDRYFWSSFAYGMAQGLKLQWLIDLNNEFLMPDLTLLLKVRPEICIQRIIWRGVSKTLFENKEYLARVWENYETIAINFFPNYITILDGEKDIQEVFSEVKAILQSIEL